MSLRLRLVNKNFWKNSSNGQKYGIKQKKHFNQMENMMN